MWSIVTLSLFGLYRSHQWNWEKSFHLHSVACRCHVVCHGVTHTFCYKGSWTSTFHTIPVLKIVEFHYFHGFDRFIERWPIKLGFLWVKVYENRPPDAMAMGKNLKIRSFMVEHCSSVCIAQIGLCCEVLTFVCVHVYNCVQTRYERGISCFFVIIFFSLSFLVLYSGHRPSQ